MKMFGRISHDFALVAMIVAVVILARLLSFNYLSGLADANPAAFPYPVVAGDSSYYARWADTLLTHHAYEDPPGKPLHAAPPGYSALLAATKAATGSITPVIVPQTLLAALAAVLIYMMARTRVPKWWALVPALLYAVSPMAVFTDSAVMTDGIFSSLIVCVVYLAFFQQRLRGVALWACVGLLLGVATMLRPIGQFLVVLFPAMLILRARIEGGVRAEHLKAAVACIVAFAVVVTPWMLRNEREFGAFEISPLGGHNLLTFNVRGFLAWRALQRTPEELPALLVLRHANDPVFGEVEKEMREQLAEITPAGETPDNYEGKLAIQYIMNDPLRYAYFHAINTLPFFLSSGVANYRQIAKQVGANEGFYEPAMLSLLGSLKSLRSPEGTSDFLNAARSAAPPALEVLWWVAVSALALAATVFCRKNFAVTLFTALVLYFAVLTGPMAMSRYRVPAEPYLLTLAAFGAYTLRMRLRRVERAPEKARQIAI